MFIVRWPNCHAVARSFVPAGSPALFEFHLERPTYIASLYLPTNLYFVQHREALESCHLGLKWFYDQPAPRKYQISHCFIKFLIEIGLHLSYIPQFGMFVDQVHEILDIICFLHGTPCFIFLHCLSKLLHSFR